MFIEIDTYNLEQANLIIAQECINQNPLIKKKQLAEELGVTERTIYRWQLDGKIKFLNRIAKEPPISKSIMLLRKLGYTVIDPKEIIK